MSGEGFTRLMIAIIPAGEECPRTRDPQAFLSRLDETANSGVPEEPNP